jgi:hypothetical protein
MAKILNTKNTSTPVNQLRLEYENQNALFDAQLPIIQRFLEAQARLIAEAYTERAPRVRFTLPDRTHPCPAGTPRAARGCFCRSVGKAGCPRYASATVDRAGTIQ